MEKNEILEIFYNTDALLKGHFLLTSGKHSDTYFQCAKVLQYPEIARKIIYELVKKSSKYEFDSVIAPAMGGILVGYEFARQTNKRFIFTEREKKEMTLRRGFSITKGERFIICEDVVTTGGSVNEVIEIVKNNGGEVTAIVSVVDRSNGNAEFEFPFYSTLKLDVITYTPNDCPICKKGLPLIKPGSKKIF